VQPKTYGDINALVRTFECCKLNPAMRGLSPAATRQIDFPASNLLSITGGVKLVREDLASLIDPGDLLFNAVLQKPKYRQQIRPNLEYGTTNRSTRRPLLMIRAT
jgi:hypothetical protein